MGTRIDLTGIKHGRLTPLLLGEKKGLALRWVCRCDCGNLTLTSTDALRSGRTLSCGCWRREKITKEATKHGGLSGAINGHDANGRSMPSKVYNSWVAMRARCSNPNDRCYSRYGGRGIKVCERWASSFEAFRDDMGPKPDGFTIERVDNDGNYEPGNCIWANSKTQVINKSTTKTVLHNGKLMCLADYARECGRPPGRLYGVMTKYQLTPELAIEHLRTHQKPRQKL